MQQVVQQVQHLVEQHACAHLALSAVRTAPISTRPIHKPRVILVSVGRGYVQHPRRGYGGALYCTDLGD
jgi:hypothetical protein